MPPKEPTDWKMTLATSCGCEDCRSLRQYVEDKHKKVMDFRLAEHRRKHIESKLDYTFRKVTIRTGTPYTLRIEKTNVKYNADLQAWKKNTVSTRSQLTALGKNSHLVDIIGEDSYKRLHQYDCLKSSIVDSNPAPASSHHLGTNATVPKKRSFIDLTDS